MPCSPSTTELPPIRLEAIPLRLSILNCKAISLEMSGIFQQTSYQPLTTDSAGSHDNTVACTAPFQGVHETAAPSADPLSFSHATVRT